jgi:hypothetical protein
VESKALGTFETRALAKCLYKQQLIRPASPSPALLMKPLPTPVQVQMVMNFLERLTRGTVLSGIPGNTGEEGQRISGKKGADTGGRMKPVVSQAMPLLEHC